MPLLGQPVDVSRSDGAADGAAPGEVTRLLQAAHGGDRAALDDALERLDPRQRQVVECRFYGGLEDEEIAAALGVTTRTVRRDWVKARAWLNRWLGEKEREDAEP